jgi:hypothetical protein
VIDHTCSPTEGIGYRLSHEQRVDMPINREPSLALTLAIRQAIGLG